MPPPRVLSKLQAEIECLANIQIIRKILQRENPTNFYAKISRILARCRNGSIREEYHTYLLSFDLGH
jgi:hypothetical protein